MVPRSSAVARLRSDGIRGGQSGAAAGFLREFRFLLSGFITRTVPHLLITLPPDAI
jgi:hypothetical protein